jgi:hypothetical protein
VKGTPERSPVGESQRIKQSLAPDEWVIHQVPAIGCTLALTQRRLILARDTSYNRPRSGIRSWPIDARLSLRAGPVRHGSGSIAVLWVRDLTTVFVPAEHWADALMLVRATWSAIRRETESG